MRLFETGKRNSRPLRSGFTLIELVVGIGIFLVLIGFVGTMYLFTVRAQSDQVRVQSVIADVNNFFEILDREIRTGYGHTFHANKDGTQLALINQNGECIRYFLSDQRIRRSAFRMGILDQCVLFTSTSPESSPVTSGKTRIAELVFGPVERASVGNRTPDLRVPYTQQGRVTVFVNACPGDDDTGCIKAQTTITSRQHSIFQP